MTSFVVLVCANMQAQKGKGEVVDVVSRACLVGIRRRDQEGRAR